MDKKVVISSLAYKFIEKMLIKVIGLVVSVILARMLTPDDFGQVAILTVFINLSLALLQSGLNTALVQSKQIEEEDYSTVFYISLAISALLVVILNATAPMIASYYKSKTLILPLRVYSFSLLFSAFNSVQIAKMQREMKFKSMMICNLVATVLSGSAGIILANLNAGLWALVIYYFSHIVFCSLAMLFAARWLPKATFSWKRAKKLFGYGWKMLISALLCSLYADLRSLIIGKKYSVEALGYYNRGQQVPDVIAYSLDETVASVMFPTLSKVQDDKDQLKGLLKRSISFGAMVVFPMMMGLAVVSESLICILFTEKWLTSVPYMQLICIANMMLPIASYCLTIVKAMGRSDIYMKLEFVRRIVMLVILTISVLLFDSVIAIAVGFIISSWLDVIIICVPIKKLITYGYSDVLHDIWKSAVASVIMAIAVLKMDILQFSNFGTLCVQVAVGVFVYFFVCFMLKNEGLMYGISVLKSLVRSRKIKGD